MIITTSSAILCGKWSRTYQIPPAHAEPALHPPVRRAPLYSMPCLLRPRNCDGIMIAIICALLVERNAVEALLDSEHETDGLHKARPL